MVKLFKKWWWLFLLLAVPLLATAGFLTWALTPLGPLPEALNALQSDGQVQVKTGPWMVFRPVEVTPETGFIIYPGGRVDPRSYAPQARAIAAQGYLVVIIPMPLNLAVFSPGAAAQVIAAYPEIKHWAVGGHSLGGSMAANFAHKQPGLTQGLVLWAAYPAKSDDLSASSIAAASIYGTQDGVAAPAEVLAGKVLLPANTTWTAITGGNHSQFGWYGDQPGDNPASISREEQQQQAVNAAISLLAQLSQ